MDAGSDASVAVGETLTLSGSATDSGGALSVTVTESGGAVTDSARRRHGCLSNLAMVAN